jgi:NlpC/P60 family putative phage cell wall peptidase
MRPDPETVAALARGWIGTPYRHRAATPGAGCDCLGLVRGVWRAFYGTEPETPPNYRPDWRDMGEGSALLDAAERVMVRAEGAPRAGQVVLFRLLRRAPPRHCGIVVGEGRFVHAQERIGVVEASLSDGWSRRIAGLFDFPDLP